MTYKIGDLIEDLDGSPRYRYCIIQNVRGDEVIGFWCESKEEAIRFKSANPNYDFSWVNTKRYRLKNHTSYLITRSLPLWF